MTVQIQLPAPAYRGINIRGEIWCPRVLGLGDVEVHVDAGVVMLDFGW